MRPLSTRVDATLLARRDEYLKLKLNLDLTRGKPSGAQLALSDPMLADTTTIAADGSTDCRNYGSLEGLPEARALFGEMLGLPANNTYALGNSSLTIMHDLIVQMLLRPVPGAFMAWNEQICAGKKPYMICPTPAYDRHHAICEMYGIRMLPVNLLDDGPDMDEVEKIITLYNVVGMWCIPKSSNPSGTTYSPEVCARLARLRGAQGFRIIWDLAYQVHDLIDDGDQVPNMLELCREAGDEDKVFYIGSTSKITFASAGIAILGASIRNLEWFKQSLTVQNIGPDKLNQLRHVRFLKSMDGIRAHMRKHREIIRPKFDLVDEVLTRELGNRGIATWNKPRGGYFKSMQVKPGCAQRVVEIAASMGVKLTPAGAAFPNGNDPYDSHIRIAPTFPPLDEVRTAIEVVALSVQIAAAE